jgi:hypothetical protein
MRNNCISQPKVDIKSTANRKRIPRQNDHVLFSGRINAGKVRYVPNFCFYLLPAIYATLDNVRLLGLCNFDTEAGGRFTVIIILLDSAGF